MGSVESAFTSIQLAWKQLTPDECLFAPIAAFQLAISLLRRIVEFDRRLRAGETVPSAHNLGLSLHRKTVGLVGMGDIAREVAKKFHYGSSCQIIVYSPTSPNDRWTTDSKEPANVVIPHERIGSLDELLARSDIVSLHCPLLPETRNMISAEQLGKMKSTAILLNLGRGGLVDEKDLYEACQKRKIFGAGEHNFVLEAINAILTTRLHSSGSHVCY